MSLTRSVLKQCMKSSARGGSASGSTGFVVGTSAMKRNASCISSTTKNGNLMNGMMVMKSGNFCDGNLVNQHRNYSSLLNWFKGIKDGSSDVSTTKSATIFPSMVDQPSETTNANPAVDANNVHGLESDDDLYRGLQLIHETPQHEYHPPLTFGEEHELFVGGHLPHTMPHINAIQDLLQYLHDTFGLPWYGAIMATTILFRCLVLPLNIGLTRNSARLDNVRPLLFEKSEIMKSKTATEEEKVQAAVEFQETMKENKCHPLLNIISPLVMAPMFLSVFVSVERICLHDPECRGTGGLWWFDDLSSVDPTATLPVISAVTWLISVEMGAAEPRTETMRQVRSVMRFVAAVMVPITGALPSGVFVYWITSNFFSMLQIYTLRLPAVRRFLGIPVKKDQTGVKDEDKTRDISM